MTFVKQTSEVFRDLGGLAACLATGAGGPFFVLTSPFLSSEVNRLSSIKRQQNLLSDDHGVNRTAGFR